MSVTIAPHCTAARPAGHPFPEVGVTAGLAACSRPTTLLSMESDAEVFIESLTRLFGAEDVIRKIDSTKPKLPPVSLFVYHNLPEDGMVTAVTYGLSYAKHPDWKIGTAELIVTVNGDDESFGLATAFFAERYRGDSPFSFGNVFTMEEPISEKSAMSGFFVFMPSFLDMPQATIELPSKKVFLKGMYPIYRGEAALFDEIGLEKFWHLDGYDMYDTNRADLSKPNKP